jgi:hypothetical protein
MILMFLPYSADTRNAPSDRRFLKDTPLRQSSGIAGNTDDAVLTLKQHLQYPGSTGKVTLQGEGIIVEGGVPLARLIAVQVE